MNIEVVAVSGWSRKKSPREHKNKKGNINKEEYVPTRIKKKSARTTYTVKRKEHLKRCLKKRQQSSPVVTFERLRSNRRYKPGD